MKNSFLNLLFLICLSTSPYAAHSDSLDDVFYSGTAAYSQGKLEEALSSFSKYLEDRPYDARAHLNLATIYAKQKKWGLGWAHFRKANAL
ncbi:MAG: tetratricopeptide repeat protein, partial [Bdellovibrionales bacterium]|nr:tetratricopeptide repeat protein [Bdellovibrionales bacterium]